MTFSPTPFRDFDPSKNRDWGNMALFIVLVLVLGYAFDVYVVKPREAQIVAYQASVKEAALAAPAQETMLAPAPRPRAEIIAKEDRITIENGDIIATISMRRPRLDDVELKKYHTKLDGAEKISLLAPAGTSHPVTSEIGWLPADKKMPMPGAETLWRVREKAADHVVLEWDNGHGLVFTRSVSLDDAFMFTITDGIENKGKVSQILTPYALISQGGIPEGHETGIVHEGAVGYVGDTYIEKAYGDWTGLDHPHDQNAQTGWIGITSRYFFVGLLPPQGEATHFGVRYQDVQNKNDPNALARYQVDTMGASRTIGAGKKESYTISVFVGPKKLRIFDVYEKKQALTHFDLAMDFGWFYFLTKPFYYALVMINDLVGNFGIAILVFTCLLRLAVFPLANASFKSFANMKRVGPQIQELQKTYVHDKRKMQEELVKLYQKEKVNPVSGCLPILVQIPVFFAMYKVISVSIDMRHAPFFGWIKDLSAPDPTSIINLFGLLPFDVHSFFHFGVWPFALFIMIMLQVRLSPPPPDPMMKIFFSYYYPIVVCFIMSKFAAGLVIYWAFSAFLSIAQQIIIMRMMGVPVHLFERIKEKRAKNNSDTIKVDE